MKITQNKVGLIHYKLTDADGVTIDSSEGRDPLAYIQGIGNLIPGLEQELEGKAAGDKFTTVVAPEHAYGKRDNALVQIVPKSGFNGADDELQEGMQVQVETDQQGMAIAVVTKIEDENVTLDLNHPLADMDLHFDVEVVEVRDATQEELDHGHAHGVGGHEH